MTKQNTKLRFKRVDNPLLPLESFAGLARPWQFLMLHDQLGWTVSYRLVDPKGSVSASSTIMGPFSARDEAENAAESKLAELRRLA